MSPSPRSGPDPEAELDELLRRFADRRPWEHQHPWAAARTVSLLRRLPAETYCPSSSDEGQLIAHYLDKSTLGVRTPLHEAVTLLRLPEEPGTYDQGHDRATQRRHARKAVKAGVTWELARSAAEKEEFLELALAKARVDLQGDDEMLEAVNLPELLDTELWLTARLDGRPVLAAVAATDHEWSLLRYFCRFDASRAASSARYLMTGVLAEELMSRGVRYLCDNKSPLRMPPGVRHFSRMVGFRTERVRVERSG